MQAEQEQRQAAYAGPATEYALPQRGYADRQSEDEPLYRGSYEQQYWPPQDVPLSVAEYRPVEGVLQAADEHKQGLQVSCVAESILGRRWWPERAAGHWWPARPAAGCRRVYAAQRLTAETPGGRPAERRAELEHLGRRRELRRLGLSIATACAGTLLLADPMPVCCDCCGLQLADV